MSIFKEDAVLLGVVIAIGKERGKYGNITDD